MITALFVSGAALSVTPALFGTFNGFTLLGLAVMAGSLFWMNEQYDGDTGANHVRELDGASFVKNGNVYILRFDYTSPPLTANQRLQWYVRNRLTQKVRGDTLDKADGIGYLGKCEISLTWYVTTRHRRDVDNVVPTLKAMCDGLVDAGLVPDDTPEYMKKNMPEIVWIPKRFGPQHMTLEIKELA